jgi:hypothetical protein
MENGKEWRWGTGGGFVVYFPRGAWTLLIGAQEEGGGSSSHCPLHVMYLLADGGRAVVEA